MSWETRFRADLQAWRLMLANGINAAQPNLSLERIYETAQLILNRLLFVRLLETISHELPNNFLEQTYFTWLNTSSDLSFITQLQIVFQNTWVSYNTSLFQPTWIDPLRIQSDYLNPIIGIPFTRHKYTSSVAAKIKCRSLYHYNFENLNQDSLGIAYEQFLAHHLICENHVIKLLENPSSRKQKGAFYTPNYIIQQIIHQTLQPLVKPKIDQAIHQLEQGYFKDAYEMAISVLDLTVLDPACGSGLFLIGAFHYLRNELKRYNDACNSACNSVICQESSESLSRKQPQLVQQIEVQIVIKMLYGVDRDPQAVLLTQLSLWLQFIQSQASKPNQVLYSCFPDLNLNIRVGDSLIHAPVDRIAFISLLTSLPIVADLAQTVRDISHQEVDRSQAIKRLNCIVSALNQQANSNLTSFFANDVVSKRPFNWQIEFPHIFDPRLPAEQQGFGVAIGNPPYFNVDATFGKGALELQWLKFAYPDIYTDKTDILFYFLRRSFELLKYQGYATFILSRAFIQGSKSQNLRKFFKEKTTLISLFDFLSHPVFKAGIATCILQFQKKLPDTDHSFTTAYALNSNKDNETSEKLSKEIVRVSICQNNLIDERWNLSPYNSIFEQIDQHTMKLKHSPYGMLMKGIDTGLDAVFEGQFLGRFPHEFLRSRVATSSIRAFGFHPPETQLIYYTHQTKWESLPGILQDYLAEHQDALKNRSVYQSSHYDWFHLHRPRVGLFEAKIFFPRRANSNRFVVDEIGSIGFKSDVAAFVRYSTVNVDALYYLCSLLNSKVLEFRYRAIGGMGKLTGRQMFEYFEHQVGDLPIPVIKNLDSHPDYQALVQLGREAHQIQKSGNQTLTKIQAQIDQIAYRLYDVTQYIDVIEQALRMVF